MARISDLSSIAENETVPSDSVLIVSDGELTKTITVSKLKSTIVTKASTTQSGAVMVGDGLDVDSDGKISVRNYSGYILPKASSGTLGGIIVGDSLQVSETGVLSTLYPLKLANNINYGLVKIGENINVTDDGIISVNLPEYAHFPDSGFTVGDDYDLSIYVDINEPIIKSNLNGKLRFINSDGDGSSSMYGLSPKMSQTLGGDKKGSLIPDTNGQPMTLGIQPIPWDSVYANSLYGELFGVSTKAKTLLVDTVYRPASVPVVSSTIVARSEVGDVYAAIFHGSLNGTAENATTLGTYNSSITTESLTVPVRDTNGDIFANKFNGVCTKSETLKLNDSFFSASTNSAPNTVATRDENSDITAHFFKGVATSSRYADLAEKYISDSEYDVGTVVIFGGPEEITVTNIKSDHRVAGVVSEKPAYLMNDGSPGLSIALRGKVPVKVFGKVSKGDLLVTSSIPGFSMSVGGDLNYGQAVFAKSLEEKNDFDRGVVTAVIL